MPTLRDLPILRLSALRSATAAAALLAASTASAQSAGGSLVPWGNCGGASEQSAQTQRMAFWTGSFDSCGISGSGDSSAGNGYMTTFATLSTDSTDWSSYSTGVSANASCFFFIPAAELSQFPQALHHVVAEIGIHVSGDVSVSKVGPDGGCSGSVSWNATIGMYEGNVTTGGHLTKDTNGTNDSVNMSDFTWAVQIRPNESIMVWMNAYASTGAGHTYQPGVHMITNSVCDFTSTLRWMGVQSVRGYDAQGNEIPLGPKFSMRLVDQFTGHDFALPAPKPCRADVNHDGIVDAADLAAVLSAWGAGPGFADINRNGLVDAADIAVLLNSWGCSFE